MTVIGCADGSKLQCHIQRTDIGAGGGKLRLHRLPVEPRIVIALLGDILAFQQLPLPVDGNVGKRQPRRGLGFCRTGLGELGFKAARIQRGKHVALLHFRAFIHRHGGQQARALETEIGAAPGRDAARIAGRDIIGGLENQRRGLHRQQLVALDVLADGLAGAADKENDDPCEKEETEPDQITPTHHAVSPDIRRPAG